MGIRPVAQGLSVRGSPRGAVGDAETRIAGGEGDDRQRGELIETFVLSCFDRRISGFRVFT